MTSTALALGLPGLDSDLQLVLFALGDEQYGVPVTAVREIIRYETVTTVPSSPAAVKGIISLRDRIIPVVDLRERLGHPTAEPTRETRIIVIEARRASVGLIVDSVDEVRDLDADSIEPPSPLTTESDSNLTLGIGRTQGEGERSRLVILLDLDAVLECSAPRPAETAEANGKPDAHDQTAGGAPRSA